MDLIKLLLTGALLFRAYQPMKQDSVADPVVITGVSNTWTEEFARTGHLLTMFEAKSDDAPLTVDDQNTLVATLTRLQQPFVAYTEASLTGAALATSYSAFIESRATLLDRVTALLPSEQK